MIRLENVGRVYRLGGHDVHALRDVTEHIRAGEHVAIMGPSGSGKSTLLNIIGCLDRPTSGSYFLDERAVEKLDEDDLARVRQLEIGFVFQSYHLLARLDALGNVELPMLFAGIAQAERHERAARALAQVGLADRVRHRPDQLSGGERQRVAIARAIVMKPRVVLADEPTGNLDTRAGAQVLDVLEGLHHAGLTLLMVTHDPGVARRAQRVIVLVDGRIEHRLAGAQMTDLATVLAAREARA